MKIIFEPKTYRVVKVAILLIAVAMLGYIGYAATQLNISNTGTVTLFHNWQGITFSPPGTQPTCATQTLYSDTPSAMTWSSIPQGSSSTGYICVKNTGGSGTQYGVTTTGTLPIGITVTYNGTATLTSAALLTAQTSLIIVVVNVALSTTTGSFSYTTVIQ